tara:strand:+ start:60 stop:512 length:453 start_codon:yes stop_codon:yes gene_type:complete
MTDKEIIHNHLNKYFKPNIKVNRNDVFKSLISVQFINDEKNLSEQALVNEMISTYGIEVIDEDVNMSYLVNDWLKDKLNNTFNDIIESLKEVKIIFGVRSWEVKRYGSDFDLDWLIEKHKNTHNKDTVVAVYNEWKHKEIIKISDEILNN